MENLKNGIYHHWDFQGNITAKFGLKDGEYHGKFERFYKSGNLMSETIYNKGEIIIATGYDQDGGVLFVENGKGEKLYDFREDC